MAAGKTKNIFRLFFAVVVCCAFPERGDCSLDSGSAKENAFAREILSRHGSSEKIDKPGDEQLLQAYSFFTRNEYGKAFPMFRSMAESGDGIAQYFLAFMYANALGVKQDDAEAAKWYRKAAEQGDADAQYELGVMYRNGTGVKKDYIEALKLLRQAAEQGEASARNTLGVMYRKGEGVKQDDVEALRWYRKAADQDNIAAKIGIIRVTFRKALQ